MKTVLPKTRRDQATRRTFVPEAVCRRNAPEFEAGLELAVILARNHLMTGDRQTA